MRCTSLRSRIARQDLLAALALFLVAVAAFLAAPVRQVYDSRYTMVVAENLATRGSFDISEAMRLSMEPPLLWMPNTQDGRRLPYQFTTGRKKRGLFYWYPPGTPILSVPAALAFRAAGLPMIDAEGRYVPQNEVLAQAILASLVAALGGVFAFALARVYLPRGAAVCVAFVWLFGTQVFSTLSRALWSDTWGVALCVASLWLLVRAEARRAPVPAVLLASLCGVLYFVRPSYASHIMALTAYIGLRHRAALWRFVPTGAAWVGLFVAYSEGVYGLLQPPYYRTLSTRLSAAGMPEGLAGLLLSPGRGLFVYVPVLAAVTIAIAALWPRIRPRRHAVLGIVLAAWVVVSSSAWGQWWGGGSFGPRVLSSALPGFLLLGVLALRATRRARGGLALRIAFGATAAVGIVIHTVGAWHGAPQLWNVFPRYIDQSPERLWSWRGNPLAEIAEERARAPLAMRLPGTIDLRGDAAAFLHGARAIPGEGAELVQGAHLLKFRWQGETSLGLELAIDATAPAAADPRLAGRWPEIIVTMGGRYIGNVVARADGAPTVLRLPEFFAGVPDDLLLEVSHRQYPFAYPAEVRDHLGKLPGPVVRSIAFRRAEP